MTTTPNMSLVLPTELGSNDQWAVILDTLFGVIDSHDHTPGKGVKVPAAGLNINADVSWSSGGTSHNITDLLALDFKPSPAASVTGLAGALFVSDGTSGLTANELYWRTTSGTNVKFTAGAALNVAAFTGGIGGDYAATGALVVFDDATDSYWFQQQVGASVRQYARMRSADVDLYEYKANPAAGVPTNRVRLASPTALAASYALTMPAALPASKVALLVDNAGAVSTGITLPAAAILTRTLGGNFMAIGVTSNATISAGVTVLGVSTGGNYFPLMMNVGEVITGWTLFLQKTSASGTISATLEDLPSTGVGVPIGSTQTNSANNPGTITLSLSGLSTTVTSGHSYYLFVTGGGVTGDTIFGMQVTYT